MIGDQGYWAYFSDSEVCFTHKRIAIQPNIHYAHVDGMAVHLVALWVALGMLGAHYHPSTTHGVWDVHINCMH